MTEKYTPTTDDLRDAWRGQIIPTDKPNVYEIIDETQADEEFDRWLAERDRQVAERAWDEGYGSDLEATLVRKNPYRNVK